MTWTPKLRPCPMARLPHDLDRLLSYSPGMADLDNQRYYPATSEETYAALRAAADRHFRVKGADDFTMAVTISTGASGFSWGATLSAQVYPQGEGSIVAVIGATRVRANFTAKSAEYKNTIKLLDAVSAAIQQAR